jgi:DNA repair protein RadD
MQLRPYQESAVSQILDYALDHPDGGSLLVVMAPRSGKTATAAAVIQVMALQQGLRALYVAQRVEHLDAAVAHLMASGIPAKDIGVIYRDRPDNPLAPFQVASEGTLDRRTKPEADIVIMDEAHHDASPRRRRIRKMYPSALHIGFTGTPERLSGDLSRDYNDMIAPVQPSELIHDGHLLVPTIYAPEDKHTPKLKGLRLRAGDYLAEDLVKVVCHKAALDKLVEEWARLAEGRITVAFGVTIEHSKAIAESFNAAGIKAKHLDGNTAQSLRTAALSQIRDCTLSMVCCVDLLSQGTDMPSVKCGILARPTMSLALNNQQGARVMTPWADPRLKTPRILDVAGNVYRHGLLYEDRVWSLRGKSRVVGGASGTGVKRCSCGAVCNKMSKACPNCHASFNKPEVVVPVVEPKALARVELTTQQLLDKQAKLEEFASRKGFGAAWVQRVMSVMSEGVSG